MRVVEALDIVEHVRACIVARAIDLSAEALGLHRRDEALDGSIVPDVAGAAHRTDDALIGKQPLERLAAVLAAMIRVMQNRLRPSPHPPVRQVTTPVEVGMTSTARHRGSNQNCRWNEPDAEALNSGLSCCDGPCCNLEF
jgi:hypothetical protein